MTTDTLGFQEGEWVQVWALVIDTNPHPEEITVRFESHNEHYNGLIRRDHAIKADPPPFAPMCGALRAWENNTLLRCEKHSKHPGSHYHDGVTWADVLTAGWMEDV